MSDKKLGGLVILCNTCIFRKNRMVLKSWILRFFWFLLGTAFGYYWCWKALGGVI